MTRNKVYLIIHTVLCIAVTALLCISVIRLYREGIAIRESTDALAWIFTRERIAAQFARIALPFFGAIGFMIAGLVLGIKGSAGQTPGNDIESTRELLAFRMKEPSDEIRKEQCLQKKLLAAGWTGFGLCMIPVLIYVVDPGHFPPDDLERMFYSLLLGTLPWTLLGLGCLMLFSFLRSRSMAREVDYMKACLTKDSGAKAAQNEVSQELPLEKKDNRRLVMWVRIIVLAAAVAMIIAGSLNGSLRDVLIKAINLCTECVGLG